MLWIPGPTHVRPEILAECARPMIGHRGAEMAALIERLDPGLRLAFGLADDSPASVAVHTATATGLMESALIGAGERVLCVVNGAFSKRWFQIAQLLGKDATALEVPWDEAIDAERIAAKLEEEGPFDALTVVASETSTGARAPLDAIARALRPHRHTLLLVDLVSYLAGAPVDFDGRRMAFAFAGVQKALALPPGIAVACASPAFLERAERQPRRGFYLDPLRIFAGHRERKTPATPCIPLYFALARQLEDIGSGATLPEREGEKRGREAWRARIDKHARMQSMTLAWARGHGLATYPPRDATSPTVSCIRAGELDAGAFVAGLKARGFQIGSGYGPLRGETFRIGHMGDHREEDLARLLAAADETLEALGSA